MKALLLLATVLTLQEPTVPAEPSPATEPQRAMPLVLTLNMPPAYYREIPLDIPSDHTIEVMIEALTQDPSQKWKPTA